MTEIKNTQMSFLNLRRSFALLASKLEGEACYDHTIELEPLDAGWRPFASSGYRNLFQKRKSGKSEDLAGPAELWSEDGPGRLSVVTRMLRFAEAAEFAMFWSATGAPQITNARHFLWLADAYVCDTIAVRAFSPHMTALEIEGFIHSRYRLIRQFAEFCQTLPDDGRSNFTSGLSMYKRRFGDKRTLFGSVHFDRGVQANAIRYLSIIPPEYRRS